MLLVGIILFVPGCFFLFWYLDHFVAKKVDKAIENHRRKKHPQLFSYINFYNHLAESCNEIYQKEYLPNLKKIDYFYDNLKYFPQDGMKSRQLELERQKQLLEDAKENMEKIWDNAQEYYELIQEYTKAHKVLWVDEHLDGFPPF